MMMKQYPLTAAQKMHDDWIKNIKHSRCPVSVLWHL